MKFKFVLCLILCLSYVTFGMANKKGCEMIEKKCGDDWQMGPFVKMKKPVLSPTADSVFKCPILGREVKFEELNSYSPATAVKDGKVYLFYRGDTLGWKRPPVEGREWNSGPTCRLAMAYSADGMNFTRWHEPVLYPDKDFMEKYEWPAGLWDPMLIIIRWSRTGNSYCF